MTVTKWVKISFKIASLLCCLLCVNKTPVHPGVFSFLNDSQVDAKWSKSIQAWGRQSQCAKKQPMPKETFSKTFREPGDHCLKITSTSDCLEAKYKDIRSGFCAQYCILRGISFEGNDEMKTCDLTNIRPWCWATFGDRECICLMNSSWATSIVGKMRNESRLWWSREETTEKKRKGEGGVTAVSPALTKRKI